MIVNLDKFIAAERPGWERLDAILAELARDPWRRLTLAEACELERLYQRASADLARLATFSAEPEARRYLENLVARGHAEIHSARTGGGRSGGRGGRLRPWRWLARSLPQAFRRRGQAFVLALVLMLGGAVFGGAAVAFDPEAKEVIMPFSHLLDDPAKRVAEEERKARTGRGDDLADHRTMFAGQLMTHNTRVTIFLMALGMTWGAGTVVLLFYNGVILGAVVVDYVLAGQTSFLAGWLLPHGAVEIPAMLIGGQAGLVLAGALLGRGQRERLAARMRAVAPDLVTLCFGAGLLLVWAGVVESFLSQYHEPVLPYAVKIAFGVVELVVLVGWLGFGGRKHGDVSPGVVASKSRLSNLNRE
ncbi:stage II sporulation protein M [Geminisphaera colitermitum]|uniref:stage II sporulation protein M n=1 Tax=Geminisphaera colitermitum TaxID=1148786 RepID=UPI0001964E13|nr:stage II sporulation protein M [Geminisphaera colitermitum]